MHRVRDVNNVPAWKFGTSQCTNRVLWGVQLKKYLACTSVGTEISTKESNLNGCRLDQLQQELYCYDTHPWTTRNIWQPSWKCSKWQAQLWSVDMLHYSINIISVSSVAIIPERMCNFIQVRSGGNWLQPFSWALNI